MFEGELKSMRCMPIIRNNEVYFTKMVEDVVYLQSGVPYKHFNIQGCDYVKEMDYFDYTLIQDVSYFVIQTVEEYTVAFVNIVLQKYRDKKIYFLDRFSEMIWDDISVEFVEDINKLPQDSGEKGIFIYSEIETEKERSVGNLSVIYSSLQVMQSLCWARKRTSLGDKNPDKTILLIEFSGKNAGMGDLVISVQQYIRLAYQRGWYPVVYLTQENQYISQDGDNMWDYYFEQPTEITTEEALESKYVIRGNENHFGVLPWIANPLCNMNDALSEKVCFNKVCLTYMKEHMPDKFSDGNNILAVIARGTDLAKCTDIKIDMDKMLFQVKETLKQGFEYVFLATEDQTYLNKFKEIFGEKLIYIEQKRIEHDYEKEEYKYVADLLAIEKANRKEWGAQYLLTTYCLAKCFALLYSIPCGALRLAKLWNDDSYQFIKCTYSAISSLSEKKEENVIHINDCELLFKNNQRIIVYGLGDVAKMIYPIMQQYRERIKGCDKRALQEEYQFYDIEVIAPTKLLKSSNEAIILITSPRCGKEIKEELLAMGIDSKKVFRLMY